MRPSLDFEVCPIEQPPRRPAPLPSRAIGPLGIPRQWVLQNANAAICSDNARPRAAAVALGSRERVKRNGLEHDRQRRSDADQ